jgi:DNA-binding beta-propeller fold protein YncE
MKTRTLAVFTFVIGLTLALTWAVTAQGPQPPGSAHMEAPFDLPNGLAQGDQPFSHGALANDLNTQSVNASNIAVGQPGLSFRYVQTFGEVETGYLEDNNHFYDVSGIATDGTNLWVTDSWGNRVVKFDGSGNFLQKIGKASYEDATGASLDYISDIGVDTGGNVWVVDSGADHVVKFDASGTRVSELGQSWNAGSGNNQFNDPISIAFDSAGNVYVSDSAIWYGGGNHRIQIFNSSGTYLHTIGETGVPGSDNNHFSYPRRIAIYANTLYVADASNHRVQIFNVSNPSSPVYIATLGVTGASGSDNLHFNNPEGVGVDANHIYVADSNNNRVQIFNRTTRVYVATLGTGSYGTGAYEFNHPTDISEDTAGNIYVADNWNKRVQQYNSSRVYMRTYGTTGVSYVTDGYHYHRPMGVAVAADGSIYIVEQRGHRLVKLNAAGIPQWTVGEPGQNGSDNDHLFFPSDVTVDSTGRVYVADTTNNRVQIFTSGGTYNATLGTGWGTGNDQFNNPTGVTVDQNGFIYVADTQNQRVQIYNASRTYVATLGVTGATGSDNTHFNSPNDVAVDANGTIYVADETNHRVQVFDASRQYVRTIGETGISGSDFGHFSSWGPHRLTVDAKNRLYVSDASNSRIQVFDAAGAYLTTIGGSSGGGNSQFSGPMGVAIGPDGAVYVADYWNNNRLQKFALGTPGWVQTNINGFGDYSNQISTLGDFDGQLYAGIYSGNGAQLWRTSDGTSWTAAITNGFGYTQNQGIADLMRFNGNLYASTNNWDIAINNTRGGEIWRSGNGVDWTRVVSQGFGDPIVNGEIYRLATFSNTLYAASWGFTTTRGAQIWGTSDGLGWTNIVTNGFGNANNGGVMAMQVFSGYLYAGTWNSTAGGEAWRTNDGTTWTQINASGFNGPTNTVVLSLAEFNGYLYAGTRNWTTGGEIWRCNSCDSGGNWIQVVGPAGSIGSGFGNIANGRIEALFVFGNRLYAATYSGNGEGMEVWRTANGTNWEQVGLAGFGDSNNFAPTSKTVTAFNNRLYIGTNNSANGLEIWKKTVTADFTASSTRGAPPLTVVFTNTSAGDYTTAQWNFGNGQSFVGTALLPPVQTYTRTGNYTVTLTVGDGVDTSTITRTNYVQVWYRVYLPVTMRNYDPLLYDNFDDPAWEGAYNPARWQLSDDPALFQVKQQNGTLVFTSGNSVPAGQGASLKMCSPNERDLRHLQIFQARVKLSSDHAGGYASVHPFVDANPINGHGWWTQCVLGAGTDRRPSVSCDVHTYVGSTYTSEYGTPDYPAQYDTWYTLRIEADPTTAHLRFYLDGRLIGEHTPSDAAALVTATNFRPDVSIWNGDANTVATRYVDDVRITPAR